MANTFHPCVVVVVVVAHTHEEEEEEEGEKNWWGKIKWSVILILNKIRTYEKSCERHKLISKF